MCVHSFGRTRLYTIRMKILIMLTLMVFTSYSSSSEGVPPSDSSSSSAISFTLSALLLFQCVAVQSAYSPTTSLDLIAVTASASRNSLLTLSSVELELIKSTGLRPSLFVSLGSEPASKSCLTACSKVIFVSTPNQKTFPPRSTPPPFFYFVLRAGKNLPLHSL